jgi:proline iminopeptidase
MKTLFPEIEPFKTHEIKVDSTHSVYVEESGNPEGRPIIFLHGGPGGGTGPKQRRFFDPGHYRIVLFDQRGCGKSSPQGGIVNNTTDDLVSDIETIRKHLGIDDWILFGGSWGSTLALAYATQHPEQVRGIILRGIFLSRPFELDWFLKEVEIFFPEKYQTLLNFKPNITKTNLVEAYHQMVFGSDQDLSEKAAYNWNHFEGSILKLLPDDPSNEESINYAEELARARVQLHYIQNQCFVDGNAILETATSLLKDIPTVIVQGQYDMVCPPKTAWDLKRAIPHAEFHLIPDAGHSASELGITSALIEATEKYKKL